MQWTMRTWGLLWSTRIRAGTTVPTSVLHGRSSPLKQRRCADDCGNGQWWWDDLEGLLKHPAFLE